MKGWSGYISSPLKQDTIPDWSMSSKHFKKDVGHGARSRTNPKRMDDDKYYYTHPTPQQPHGTRVEKSLFDKALHKIEKVGRYIKHDIFGEKRPEQIEKEEADKITKSIGDRNKAAEFNKFLQEFPFEEGQK